MNTKTIKGIVFSVSSAALFGLSAVMTKMLIRDELSLATLVWVQGLCGAAILWLIGLIKKNPIRIKNKKNLPKIVLAGGLGMSATQIVLDAAYMRLPVGTVITIHYLYPVIVVLLSAVFFKQKISRVLVFALAITFVSMNLLFEEFSQQQIRGAVLAILSVASWSFLLLYTEHSGILDESADSVTCVFCLVLSFSGLALGLFRGSLQPELVLPNLTGIAAIAIINNVLADCFMQIGIKNIGANLASILSIVEPLSSMLLGFALLGENLTVKQYIACSLILLGMVSVIVYESRRSTKN